MRLSSLGIKGEYTTLGWSLADQSVSSLANLALSVVVARASSAHEFGLFTLAFATFSLSVEFTRSVVAQPLVVRFSAAVAAEWSNAVRLACGVALLIGLFVAAASVGVGVFWQQGAVLVVIGAFIPALLLQDVCRFAFFAAGRGRAAFMNDLIWLTILGTWLVVFRDEASVVSVSLAWAVAGTVAACIGFRQANVGLSFGLVRWFRQHGPLAWRYFIEFVALSGSAQLIVYATAAFAGLAAAGSLRSGQVLMGPVTILFLAANLGAAGECARLADRPHRLRGFVRVLGVGLLVVAVVWGSLVKFVPDTLGRQLLGESWAGGRSLVLPLMLALGASGLAAGPSVALRGLGAASMALRSRIVVAMVTVAAGCLGAAIWGAFGAASGSAVGAALGAGVWWASFKHVFRLRYGDAGP